MSGDNVDFGSVRLMGVLGVVAGAAMAIGVPWVVLTNSGDAGLGGFAATLLAVLGIAGGSALSIVAVFFSIVVVSKADKR